MKNAKAAGMLIGSYHFAHPLNNPGTNGAIAEAQHFLAVAKPYITNGYLPAVLDVEDEPFGTDPSDPCADETVNGHTSLNLVCKMGKPALSAWVRAWTTYVKQQTGITPMLYMNRNSATTGMEDDLAVCPLWLAYFKNPPDVSRIAYPPWSNSWTFLQYSFTNTLSGVPQPTVDFNLFNGDARALKLWAAQIATTNIIPAQFSAAGGGPILPPTNGLFTFEVSSPTQTTVPLQTSTDVTNWVNAGSVAINHGHGTFTTIFNTNGQRYYRPHP
jgi:GH25 family lysozyme M1 (1,4-beta-N-acetylmuramidase)